MVCFRYIIINTLHKGDDDDDDDDNNNNNNNNATKILQQKQLANADSVNNLLRQWKTSYQHAQCWLKNNT
jgi:hypothetical protein